MKKTTIIIVIIVVIIAGIGIYLFSQHSSHTPPNTVTETPAPTLNATSSVTQTDTNATSTLIGKSVNGNDITAYHYGTGKTEVLFVGGIHGGYEWNTSLVAFQLMDYLASNPNVIPSNVEVTVIPVLNPDGLQKVTGTTGRFTAADVTSNQTDVVAGRFNANNVDLNRNFDCDWQANGVWQNKTVSGGSSAFSEPESLAIKNYVESHHLSAVVAFYSSAGGVFASNCHKDVSPDTATLTKIYSDASGYPAHESYDFYAITGDMVNWLAKNNIPGISVLLTNHTDTEWTKNQAGITAILNHFAQ